VSTIFLISRLLYSSWVAIAATVQNAQEAARRGLRTSIASRPEGRCAAAGHEISADRSRPFPLILNGSPASCVMAANKKTKEKKGAFEIADGGLAVRFAASPTRSQSQPSCRSIVRFLSGDTVRDFMANPNPSGPPGPPPPPLWRESQPTALPRDPGAGLWTPRSQSSRRPDRRTLAPRRKKSHDRDPPEAYEA